MRKTKHIACCLLMASALLGFASCGDKTDPDGLWDPMEWVADHPGNPTKITAEAKGGTFAVTCTNYSRPWLEPYVIVDGKKILAVEEGKEWDYRHIKKDWYEIEVKGNTYWLTIEPNTTGRERTLDVQVTAGDIFDTINIVQKKE